MSSSVNYRYRDDGLLPTGLRLPDLPFVQLLLERKDLGRAALADALVDTGFDAEIYSNLELADFLVGLKPLRTDKLESPGHVIEGEVFKLPCYLSDERLRRKIYLGDTEIFVAVQPLDLTQDVLIGRRILNRLHITLDGPAASLAVKKPPEQVSKAIR